MASVVLKFKFSDDPSHDINFMGTSIMIGPGNVFVGVEKRIVPG